MEVNSEIYNFSIPSCLTCHYSKGGMYPCGRMMDNMIPKIDMSKGYECAHNGFVHYIKFGSISEKEMKEYTEAWEKWWQEYQGYKKKHHQTKIIDQQ